MLLGWEIGSGERFTVNRSSYTPNYSVDRIRPSSILGCFIDCFGPDMTSWFGLWPCSVAGPCSGLPNKHCALGLVKERGPEVMEVCNRAMAPRVHGAVFHPQKRALCPRGGDILWPRSGLVIGPRGRFLAFKTTTHLVYCLVAMAPRVHGAVFHPQKRALCPRGGIYCGPVAPWSSGRGAVFLASKQALTWFIVWWVSGPGSGVT